MKHIDIIDILTVLLKRKKTIIIPTAVISVAAVVYILLVPKFWVSTTTFLPAKQSSSMLPQLGSQFLAAGMSFMGQHVQVESLDMLTIINSRTFSEDVINEFDLIAYLEIEHDDPRVRMEMALQMLHDSIKTVSMSRETGLVTLSIETKDNLFSADIANYYVEQLAKYNREDRITKARLNREYLEQQVEEVRTRIDRIASEITAFQSEHNVLDLKIQAEKMLSIYADMVAEYNIFEIEYRFQKEVLRPDVHLLRQLEIKDNVFRQKISEAELLQEKESGKFVLALTDIPELSRQYLDFELELEINKRLLEFLYPRFEEAKIMELRDMPTLEIVDTAVPAGKRSKPRRARFCIAVFMISLVTFSIAAIAIERIQEMESGPDKKRIEELKKHLLFFRKK